LNGTGGRALALIFATLSSICFGLALVTGRVGLRVLDARSGAAISIPTAAVLFVIAAPFALNTDGFDLRAAWLFAAVGLVFPAVVTILTFRSNELLGPTVTSAVSGTAPLFALLGAGLFLDERVPVRAALSAIGVIAGVALLSSKKGGMVPRTTFIDWQLMWPIAGAIIRGLAQVGAKGGLRLWASPFAAALIGYVVSSTTVIVARQLRASRGARLTGKGVAWFAGTGVLNGAAVLLMYAALAGAPVWTVVPIVASYPLITAIVSMAVLSDEKLSLQVLLGASITVVAVVYLVSLHGG
jgi:drug/metabolite transporter (DMT)-like permease